MAVASRDIPADLQNAFRAALTEANRVFPFGSDTCPERPRDIHWAKAAVALGCADLAGQELERRVGPFTAPTLYRHLISIHAALGVANCDVLSYYMGASLKQKLSDDYEVFAVRLDVADTPQVDMHFALMVRFNAHNYMVDPWLGAQAIYWDTTEHRRALSEYLQLPVESIASRYAILGSNDTDACFGADYMPDLSARTYQEVIEGNGSRKPRKLGHLILDALETFARPAEKAAREAQRVIEITDENIEFLIEEVLAQVVAPLRQRIRAHCGIDDSYEFPRHLTASADASMICYGLMMWALFFAGLAYFCNTLLFNDSSPAP